MAGILVHPATRRHLTPASKLAGDPGHRATRCGLRNAGERKQDEGECSNDGGTHREFSKSRAGRDKDLVD